MTIDLARLREAAERQLATIAHLHGEDDWTFRRFDERHRDCPMVDGHQQIGWWAYPPKENPLYLGWSLDDAKLALGCLLGGAYGSAHSPAKAALRPRSQIAAAKDWLAEILEFGPRPAREVHELGAQEGFSKRTLQRAAESLQSVETERIGFGRGSHIVWRLIDDDKRQ